jgi:hypothetical protein
MGNNYTGGKKMESCSSEYEIKHILKDGDNNLRGFAVVSGISSTRLQKQTGNDGGGKGPSCSPLNPDGNVVDVPDTEDIEVQLVKAGSTKELIPVIAYGEQWSKEVKGSSSVYHNTSTVSGNSEMKSAISALKSALDGSNVVAFVTWTNPKKGFTKWSVQAMTNNQNRQHRLSGNARLKAQ